MKNRSVKISPGLRDRYEKHRLELLEKNPKAQNSDSPMLPIEKWERGEIGKFYRREMIADLKI